MSRNTPAGNLRAHRNRPPRPTVSAVSSAADPTPDVTVLCGSGLRVGHSVNLYVDGVLDGATAVTHAMVNSRSVACAVANALDDGSTVFQAAVTDGRREGPLSHPLTVVMDVP